MKNAMNVPLPARQDRPTIHPRFRKVFKKQLYYDLLRVKEIIKRPEFEFDMSKWGSPTHCGTAKCLGGWLSFLLKQRRGNSDRSWYYRKGEAAEGSDLFDALFFAYWSPKHMQYITVKEACAAVDTLITTGSLPKVKKKRTFVNG